MLRLRCGVIFLDGFLDHLGSRAASGEAHQKVTSIEYLRCVEGERKGRQWWRLGWVPERALPADCLFKLSDDLIVAMSPQTQRGLRHRWIDYRDGEVVVG